MRIGAPLSLLAVVVLLFSPLAWLPAWISHCPSAQPLSVQAFWVAPAIRSSSRHHHNHHTRIFQSPSRRDSGWRAFHNDDLEDASNYHCTVVGKIILDDYRPPGRTVSDTSQLTVGGGGPQAAWGAAAACALLRYYVDDDRVIRMTEESSADFSTPPPPQPVSFWGPVGAWSDRENAALEEFLRPCVQEIHLLTEPSLQTPTIQLWHDDHQDIQWTPLHNSWGSEGADALWRNRPSADDLLAQQQEEEHDETTNTTGRRHDHLHMILEMGATAAGGGQDGALLLDPRIARHFAHMSLEPIAFPSSESGSISPEDTESCRQRLSRIQEQASPKNILIVPDQYLYEAVLEAPAIAAGAGTTDKLSSSSTSTSSFWDSFDVAARYGPQGSLVAPATTNSDNSCDNEDAHLHSYPFQIPVASLQTPDGQAVNPTGAGNAYSAAVAVCRAHGWDLVSSACVASAVGAAVCEYDHLPPWTWKTLQRIRQGACEIAHDRLGVTLPFSGDRK